ncbi:Oidioi.mRNA.OKI2018_I69.chr1.g2183.t1.cds [Oikopleura dioica]|uniref:Oidioi.mRNA.OKI2018_I69.chr1.g2183.t1.cds n=1 Tax=Oikopleura dioica TaxID=34765 RepID=A0ABN7SVF7_OIKDI|nr:Oidioi.mRNA.OKI2018_I69.chr1.g2183.t1.cds [Oikopleura dioica]
MAVAAKHQRLFDKALEALKRSEEKLSKEGLAEEDFKRRLEIILLQRAKVAVLSGDLEGADLNAQFAIDLKMSTRGYYLLGIVAEQRLEFKTAAEYFKQVTNWPSTPLAVESSMTKKEKLQLLETLVTANSAKYRSIEE